jgi:uncharacterized membrane protein
VETQALKPVSTVGGSYKYGWQQMKKYFLPLLLVMLVIIIAEIPAGLADIEVNDDFETEPFTMSHAIGMLYWFLLLPVFQYGAHFVNLKAARNQDFEVKEMFVGFEKYLNIVLANLLMMALVGIGLVVFIIPGIIVLCRLAFVPYLVMDSDLGPVEAVQESWQLSRGKGWTVFGIGLLAIPIIFAGFLLVFVGVIFAAMWIYCSFAGFYQAISNEQVSGIPTTAGERASDR